VRICLVANLNIGSRGEGMKTTFFPSPPIGLLSLASVLQKHSHEVMIVDFNTLGAEGEFFIEQDFIAKASRYISSQSPEIVGFSTMCSSYHIALRLAESLKKQRPEIVTLLGGPQASVTAVATLTAFPFVDMVLRGEAEATLPRLINALAANDFSTPIAGLTWRRGGRIQSEADTDFIEDLDVLPVPAFELLPRYDSASWMIDDGRGCPFSCSFCSTSRYWGHRVRTKSPDRVLREIQILCDDFGMTSFGFTNDLFIPNEKRIGMLDRLKSLKPEITWSGRTRLDCLTVSLLEDLAAAGCRSILIGVESGSAKMLRGIGKSLPLDKLQGLISAANRVNIHVTISLIAGFPHETEDDLSLTLDLVRTFLDSPGVISRLHLLAPLAGTPDYARFSNSLRYDESYSDISGTKNTLSEPVWFNKYPELFSSFYYYETDYLPRRLLRELDRFVNIICHFMPESVLFLSSGGKSLWSLYQDWRNWADGLGVSLNVLSGLSPHQLLLKFFDFVYTKSGGNEEDIALRKVKDEILEYCFRHDPLILPDVVSKFLNPI